MTHARAWRAGVAAAMLAVATPPVAAQGFRDACAADIEKHCPGIKPGSGRILQCLKSRGDALAPGCKSALETLADRMKSRRG